MVPTLELSKEVDENRELSRRVQLFLHEAHMPGLRNLVVDARDGIVTLTGEVKTYYEKQLGNQRARRVAGVVKLVDKIRVSN